LLFCAFTTIEKTLFSQPAFAQRMHFASHNQNRLHLAEALPTSRVQEQSRIH
jgi:hypothetical protein